MGFSIEAQTYKGTDVTNDLLISNGIPPMNNGNLTEAEFMVIMCNIRNLILVPPTGIKLQVENI